MPDVNPINGTDAADGLTGTAGADLIYGFDPDGPQAEVSLIQATRVATGLNQPLFATASPGDENRLFVVEKGGVIKVVDLRTGAVAPFIDLSAEVATTGEQGLLGLTFHPDFAANGRFYVNLSARDGDTEIREYRVTANPNRADPASGRLIIEIPQPDEYQNHKAGWIDFGPDGYLYIATGDGGGGGDPNNNAQNLGSLLGKMLRLDVDGDDFPSNPNRNYAVPADNPFVGREGADEIWASGLRNPFRNSFDRGTDDLFIADVGQNEWEEVNLGEAGANYGWDRYEGPDLYEPGPAPDGLVDPIFAYAHDGNRQSITGGYVYRGGSDGLHGRYFFADFVDDRIWTLENRNGTWVPTDRTGQIVTDTGGPITNPASFGEDAEGNLYVVSISGDVFRLDPRTSATDGADTIGAGDGDDRVYAGGGADVLRGDAGRDRLHGMEGNDTLAGGGGADALFGGDGRDAASYAASGTGVTASLDERRAGTGDAAGDAYGGIENLVGSRFADRLFGDDGRNLLRGFDGDDRLDGGRGADTMRGETGSDVYVVDDAGDRVIERAGDAGRDAVFSFRSFSLAGTEVETLRLGGTAAIDGMGSAGADRLFGNDAANVLTGGLGADATDGSGGADVFRFRTAADSTLDAAGRDVVVFSRTDGDRIDLSAIDADTGSAADDAFALRGSLAEAQANAGSVYLGTQGASGRVLLVNTDADAAFEMAITIAGVSSVSEADFIL